MKKKQTPEIHTEWVVKIPFSSKEDAYKARREINTQFGYITQVKKETHTHKKDGVRK